MNITKAQAKKITSREPRKVHYCLWNDGTKAGKRNACAYYDVIECKDRDEAQSKARDFYKTGREHKYNGVRLHRHMRDEYSQREGMFVPTVFTYPNGYSDGWHYGYFVTRWSLDYDSDIAGKLNCNMYASLELDTEKPEENLWLCNEIEKITA